MAESVETPKQVMDQTGGADGSSSSVTPNAPTPATSEPSTPQASSSQDNGPQLVQRSDAQRVSQPPKNQNADTSGAAPEALPSAVSSIHPAVQKAGLLHTIAETLAGGPRYKESVDINTGKTVRTKVPLSRGDIGMAIAMSAISGALSGLTAKGTNSKGEAGARGFETVAAQRQKANDDQKAQSNSELAHQYQVYETNLRLYNNAAQAGRMGFEANKEYVDQNKPLADKLISDYPQAVRGHATEKDFAKYHIAKDSAIPYQVVKRLDPSTGEQIKNSDGVPQWDIDYLVVDPKFKADDLLSDEDRQLFAKYGLQGFTNSDGEAIDLPQSMPLKLNMAINYKSQVGALRMAERDLGDYYDTLNTKPPKLNFDLKSPTIPDQNIEAMIDDAATKYGVDPALARGVALKETGGRHSKDDGSVVTSPKGALGVMQLMPDTAKKLGVDPNKVEENIDGGVRYLKSMLDRFDGDPRLALAAYNAGPGAVTNGKVPNIPETQDYVKSISDMIGLGSQKGTPDEAQKFEPVDLVKAIKNDPTLVSAITKFQAMTNRTGNIADSIAQLQKTDPQAAGKIMQLYGGRTAVDAYDQQRTLSTEQKKDQVKAQEQLSKEADSRRQKEAEDEPIYRADAKDIAGDPNDPGSGSMDALDKLISQRTKDRPKVMKYIREINPNWSMANAQIKLALWHDFTASPNGKEGDAAKQMKSFNTLYDHIGGAIDASEKYGRSNTSDFVNKPLNWWKQHAENDPMLNQFRSAIEPVKTEFMTFLNNNHALSDHDKQTGDVLLSDTMTPAQLEASLKSFAETAAYRLKELDQSYFRVFKNADGSKGHFPGLISPDALNGIMKMTNADGSNSVADILKDMDTGGSILGSKDGRGTPGKKVADALGRNNAQAAKYQYTTKDGKLGWDVDRKQWVDTKTGQPQAAPSQLPASQPPVNTIAAQ